MSTLPPIDRQTRLSALATAAPGRLGTLWDAWRGERPDPAHTVLRTPETGTVMVRGRAGAVGAPFNLGEITVTRCAVRLPDGAVGHGYVQGRDRRAATIAALLDAMAEAGDAAAVDAAVTRPLLAEADDRAGSRAQKAAATRVEFFTLVRGDN